MSKIIIAIPRGRIIKELKNILLKTSFAPEDALFDDKSRKLTFLSKNKDINFIKVRAFDACTFVAFGAAQIGIAGEDVIK
jgi:ATP phosphoribosyltransferase